MYVLCIAGSKTALIACIALCLVIHRCGMLYTTKNPGTPKTEHQMRLMKVRQYNNFFLTMYAYRLLSWMTSFVLN